MNFTNPGGSPGGSVQPQQVRTNQRDGGSNGGGTALNVATTPHSTLKNKLPKSPQKWFQGGFLVLLLSVTVILVGVVYLLHLANPNASKYVAGNKLQAVFLQNGQVYFGHIRTISQRYIKLQDIYYLNNANASANTQANTTNNLSLVKLGCELHGPYDEMIINQQQVTFWENLRDDSQVAKAVAQYQKDNQGVRDCSKEQASTTTDQSSSTTTQGAPATTNAATTKKQ